MAKRRQAAADAMASNDLTRFRALDLDGEMRQLLDHVRALVTQTDEEGRIVYVNSSVKAVTGYEPEEMIGRHGQDFTHADDVEIVEALSASDPERLTPEQLYRTRRKDGGWAWVETAFAKRVPMPDGSVHRLIFAREVTDLVDAGMRIRESEERYRMVVESSTETVTETDLQGRLLYGDDHVADMLGYTSEELHAMGGFVLIHEDDVDRVRAAFNRAFESAAKEVIEPYRVRHREGHWRWLTSRSIGYRAVDGETRFLNVTRDVTEEIEREREQREFAQRTEQARRLESLGVLAGGVAHDFSNLLTPILGEANLALADLPEGSPLRKRLERIAHSARRASDLTKQMLAYAGADDLETAVLELSALMEEAPRLVESLVSSRTTIDYQLAEGLPSVEGNSAQLLQVAMNLVTNAGEALGEEPGTISIRTGSMDLRDTASYAFSYGTLDAGEYVYLEVQDDGCGMDADTKARIFDPFFTTKFTGRGLGLAAVLGIVRAHGGALDLDSEPGRGTRFRVIFPVKRVDDADLRAERDGSPTRGGLPGTVLLIDDDDAVVEIAAETLRRAGYRVLGATEAAAGVDLLREHRSDIVLVLLDRAMPGVSGTEVIHRLREIDPEVPVLLVSGYSESRIASEFADEGLAGHLQKPFMPEGLVEKVKALLA